MRMVNKKKDYFVFTCSSVTAGVSSFFCSLILVHIFGAKGAGLFVSVKLVPMVLYVFFSFGLPFSGIYYLSRKEEISVIVSILFFFSTAVAIFLLLLGYLFQDYIGLLIYKGLDKHSLLISLFIIPIFYINRTFENIYRGIGRNDLFAYQNIVRNCLVLFLISSIWVFQFPIGFIPMAILISEIIIFIYLAYFVIAHFKISVSILDIVLFNKMFSFGLKSQVGNIFSYLNVRFDQLIINILLPLQGLGVYSTVVNLAEFSLIPQRAIGAANLSHAAQNAAQNENIEHLRFVKKLYIKMVIITSMFLLISLPLFAFFVPIIYGKEFNNSFIIFATLLPGILAISCNSILSTTLTGYGFPQLPSIANLCACILTIGFDLVLIPKFGIIGAAIASSFAYNCQGGVTLYFFLRVFNGSFKEKRKLSRV